jgi:hypothetical protein
MTENLTDIELLLEQTASALHEVTAALANHRLELGGDAIKALGTIASALTKREPMDLLPLIRELREMKTGPAIQVMPAPVQFLPCPDAVYEVEVHPTVGGRQRMTIRKSTPSK